MQTQKTFDLSPAQRRAFDALHAAVSNHGIVELSSIPGLGRTTILKALHEKRGGTFLDARTMVEAMEPANPLAIEETIYRRLITALAEHEIVVLDDLHLLMHVVAGCHAYPRANLMGVTIAALAEHCAETGTHLVLGGDPFAAHTTEAKAWSIHVEAFDVEDYAHIGRATLGESRSAGIDFKKVFRFASRLTARQLRETFESIALGDRFDTDHVIDVLRSQQLASNVDIDEVQQVDLADLKGIDDVIEALEAHIIIPLEQVELSNELDLKPKRGVLLAGPPGTGKTTIGRALARRLRGKFFLIDGTFIHGSQHFYQRVAHVFEAAKQNAPGVIFIDDSDVIFESGGEAGLYRYLLTMLDGLESESAGRVCVIMTAMDVGNLPPALVRSGRIELWLETRYPDLAARKEILSARIGVLPPPLGDVELDPLGDATDGLSGADLKRVVEDAKVLFTYDRARGIAPREAIDYFTEAANTVRRNRERYAEAEARARVARPNRPPFFDIGASMAFAHQVMVNGLITDIDGG